jgi:hypothetical protein
MANADALTEAFYDSGKVATWVRDHSGLVLWVREKIGKPLVGWRPYGAWADVSEEVSSEYLFDGKLRIHTGGRESPAGVPAIDGLQRIRELLDQPGKVARLVGLSGVGKTRLLQALFEAGVGSGSLSPSLAFYTNVPESPDPQPTALASQLIAGGNRGVLVVDNCPLDLHRRLSQVCRSPRSTVSVITVEYDIRDDLPEGTEVFRLDTSSPELIEKLIRRRFKDASPTDARTITSFSDGNARVAIALAGTVGRGETIEGLKDEDLIERLIRQRHEPDPSLSFAAQVCSLVYSFDGQNVGAESELARLGALAGQSVLELYRHVAELLSRGLAQQRGVWRAILPQAVANRLATTALQRVPFSAIEACLIHGAPERLLKSFSRRLGYLHTSGEAVAIVNRWLGVGGMLDNIAVLDDARKAIFENIAPVVPEAALLALERGMPALDHPETVRSYGDYARILRSLAYDPVLFSRCVALLARIAAAGDLGGRSNPALNAFMSLFQLYFSGTHALIEQRLDIIRPLLSSGNAQDRTLGLKALEATLEAWHFQPFHDFEFGARSRDYGYWPHSQPEAEHWFGQSLGLSAALACGDEPTASKVRALVASKLRGIWTRARAYDEIESACRAISEKQFWPEGWIAVRQIQHYDSKSFTPDVSARLESLEALLRPTNIVQKVRSVVLAERHFDLYVIGTEEGRPVDVAEGMARASTIAHDLGEAVAADERAFDQLVPELVSHNGELWPFGQGLARGADNPREIWRRLAEALAATPEGHQRIQVLCGFLHALHAANPALANVLLDLAVQDTTLAPWLPSLQRSAGIDQPGVQRLMSSLSSGLTPIESYRWLSGGGAADSVPPDQLNVLVLEIASKPGGFDVAADVLNMRLHGDQQAKKEHALEIIEAGRQLIRQMPFGRTHNDDLDASLDGISKACLGGEEGRVIVGEVCRKLKDAAARYEACAFYYNEFIGGLFAAQPTAALDALCGGGTGELEKGLGIIRDLRQNPIDSVPEAELFAWCDREPTTRYPAIATAIGICHSSKEGEPPQWTNLALRLLDKACDRIAVLQQYIAQIELMSCRGFSTGALASNIKLLDSLPADADPAVGRFVAQERTRLGLIADVQAHRDREGERERDERFEY